MNTDNANGDLKIAAETFDILAMFVVMRRSYAALSDDAKSKVDAAAEEQAKFGFEGFDPNHHPHAFVAHDLAKLSCFEEIKDWAVLNSGTVASLTIYRRMLSEYQRLRREHDLQLGAKLTADQIMAVLWKPIVSSGKIKREENVIPFDRGQHGRKPVQD